MACALPMAATAQDRAPLSAIGWLSDSVALPAALPRPVAPDAAEPPVASNALPGRVTVRPLDGPDAPPAALGLFSPASRGLPSELWAPGADPELGAIRPATLASSQRLLHDLLAADPGRSGADDADEALFLERVDALMGLGQLDTARSMLDLAGRDRPRSFRRWFDIALLTGQENAGCSAMRRLPQITPTYPARIFCLARGGDWRAAELTLETARSLDVITAAEAERLRLFLDELADPLMLPPPVSPTPLDFAILAAVGEPLRTPALPLAFAHADLRPITGWKLRLDAAERLARRGAITADRLWQIYHERSPAASGALWDRVELAQELDAAVEAADPARVSALLPQVWDAMQAAGLPHALAMRYADDLGRLPLTGPARDIAAQLSALTGAPATTPLLPFVAALVGGGDAPLPAQSPLEAAIADGLQVTPPPARASRAIAEGRRASAAIDAAALLDDGAEGNLDAIRQGLATLVAAGFHDTARRAAIELAILGPDA
ncbi:hypothetical protein SAMN04488011_101805 [Palleronia pelagia]|uniref:Uncharacterized protein n=2 Tax=Palleronia pelagia TaxID=387096 RepID=A0A1H8BZU4_9RHOB|nr:hypothetical protein SAMN04488011_101805 [Palleronia pelagia]